MRRRYNANANILFVEDSETQVAIRYKMPLSCIMIDIDHFKAVNDTYGHTTGDAVIKDVALLIQRGVRDVDTVWPNQTITFA